MAGDHHGPLHEAIEKFYHMRENLADNYRFTRKSGRFVLIFLGLVPAVLFYGAYRYSIDFAAKRRSESIWRQNRS